MERSERVQTGMLVNIWIAVRFIVFGIGGFGLLMFGWIVLILRYTGEHYLNPFLALPFVLAGALMMLFGAALWGRWAYIWVFLSMPIAISVLLLASSWIDRLFPGPVPGWLDWLGAKPIGYLIFAAPMPLSYLLVARYYRRMDARAAELNTNSQIEGPR